MPRNVLFITADQWRGECLSCLGHFVETPYLDALAAEGVLFANHFANAAPCGPSRASIHTSLYQHEHGVTFNHVPLSARYTNWALQTRWAGLDPVLFGYTDTTLEKGQQDSYPEGVLPGLAPIVQLGKNIWEPVEWADWLATKGHPVPDSLADLYMKTKPQPVADERNQLAPALEVPAELHDTYFMVEEVLDYIRDRSGWCVHLSLLRPHPPWTAPEPYNRLYPPGDLPSPNRAADPGDEAKQHPFLAYAMNRKHQRMSRDDASRRRWQSGYYGLMTEVDHNLGRLFAALKASGAWDDTLVVFTSDHGEQLGDHWLIGKLGYFDESFHVPMIVFNPAPDADSHRGRRIDAFTEGVDITPTLLDWLGVDIPEQCRGESLLPATTNGDLGNRWRTEAHWEFDFSASHFHAEATFGLNPAECRLAVVRGESSKYVYFPGLPDVFFDLADDPRESVNLASDPRYRTRVEEDSRKLQAWSTRRGP
ncbi:MAG: sulfatase-like hydrolase/transferase [Gammaproteobacteria bacterium]|nr:sulfatase-like hydrolase/transferase [Gammaproteobacteria bacterium]